MTEISLQARRITFTLFIAQSLFSAGFIAASTINSILGAELSGARWAGVPAAVLMAGAALAASVWSPLMDRIGRRNGIALGLLLGVVGLGSTILAANQRSLLIMLVGMGLLGFARAAVMLARFAAAEVHPPKKRGGAVANVVLGGTVGAVLGPLLIGPMGAFSLRIGMNELAGGYLAGMALLGLAALAVLAGLRPDPRDLARKVAELYPASTPDGKARPPGVIFRQPVVLMAVTAMVLGQVVMIALMVITSLHMREHSHGLGSISTVFSAHTIGMYAFSVISGRLLDQWGREPVILTGALMLLAACATAPLSPDLLPMIVSLFLLGLGWNFCFVGGSTLLSDQLSPQERASIQGTNDLLVWLAAIALTAGLLSLIPLGLALTGLLRRRVPART